MPKITRPMTLQKKTLFFSCIFIATVFAAAGGIFKFQLYDSFLQAERNDVASDVAAARKLFNQNLEEFSNRFADWSSWDDAYHFAVDLNPEFIHTNLNNESIVNLHLNLAAFADPSGRILFAKGFDLAAQREIPFSKAALEKKLLTPELLAKVITARKNLNGIAELPEGVMEIAMRPLLTSKNEGPVHGVLIVGRFLNERETERLSRLLGFSLHFDRIKRPDGHADFTAVRKQVLERASDPESVVIRASALDQLAGYCLIYNLQGSPLLIMRAERPRKTYRQYRIALTYFAFSLIFFALSTMAIALVFLHKFILARLASLSEFVERIQRTDQLSICLLERGNDEIAILTRDINKMLGRIRRDFEEKKELEGRMLHSQKMAAVGQMAAGIAHEIKTPITVIQLYADRALGEKNLQEESKHWFLQIKQASQRGAQVVHDLLTFSRTGTNEKESTQVNEAIDEALSVLGISVKYDDIEIVKDYEEGLPPIPLFKSRFQQVIANLFSNAIDAMERRGRIVIRTRKSSANGKAGGMEVTVTDSGRGIPPEILGKIFDPFFTTKKEGEGTGLGLAMVYEIMEQHQGSLSVDSTVGRGTSFRLFFPF